MGPDRLVAHLREEIAALAGDEPRDDPTIVPTLKQHVDAFLRGEVPLHVLVTTAFVYGNARGFIRGWWSAEETRTRLVVLLGDEACDQLGDHPNARRVLTMMADGKTYDEIGAKLGITAEGVRWHVKEAAKVLGIPGVRALKRRLGAPLRNSSVKRAKR